MAEAKTREQLETDWWDAWWRADFSWAGLENKLVGEHGGLRGEKTLRDYWCRDPATGAPRDEAAMWEAGELVDCDRTIFHIAHLPPKTKSGVETWKARPDDPNWRRLNALLAQRIDAGAETEVGSFGLPEGPDGRAQFVGVVLRGGLSHPKGDESSLHLNAMLTATLYRADYVGRRFGPGAQFVGAIFSGGTNFDGATFSGDAGFYGATFLGDAGFDNAIFSGDASFDNATFSGRAHFSGKTTFSGNARFNAVTFSELTRFGGAIFSGNANFDEAIFSGDVEFSRAIFRAEAIFDKSVFAGVLQFIDATVIGTADFEGGRCEGRVWFDGSKFSGKFRAAYREFLGRTYFDSVKFSGPMEFQIATFEKYVSFEKLKWPTAARDWHGAFWAAQFRSPVSFEGAGFGALAAFDGAILESKIWIDAVEEGVAKSRFSQELKAAIKPDASDGAVFEKNENEERTKKDGVAASLVTREEINKCVKKELEERLEQLEGGCRVLKEAMGRASAKSREQMFYRFELLARRKRRKLRPGEKFFSFLYGFASDYGASMLLPLFWLIVLIALFSVGFLFWAFALGFVGAGDRRIDVITAAWQAFDLSWANVFKPLFALSTDAQAEGSLGDRLLGATPSVAFAARAAATIQSLFAIVLAFLFALAVRRRFQIN